MNEEGKAEAGIGATLALVVGIGVLGGAAYLAATGSRVPAVIFALIGASALNGWLKLRKKA